jgi:hypothetical protein
MLPESLAANICSPGGAVERIARNHMYASVPGDHGRHHLNFPEADLNEAAAAADAAA